MQSKGLPSGRGSKLLRVPARLEPLDASLLHSLLSVPGILLMLLLDEGETLSQKSRGVKTLRHQSVALNHLQLAK